jgi:tRNA A-37 threonylcarbamoyl transferase component Bud32|tara:strand:+ start:960 stop:1184 length:225 start_codon:yes stop_codon:yes gene_type:complete
MISQFKSKKALKKIRNQKRKIRLKNIEKQLDRHRNSPNRRRITNAQLGVEYQRGVAQESIQTKISPMPVNQEKV